MIILIIEKYILSPVLDKLPSVVRHIYSIVLVVIGWVLFFSPSFGGAARYLGMMFGAGAHGVADRESLYLLTTNLVLWIILIIVSTPLTAYAAPEEVEYDASEWNRICGTVHFVYRVSGDRDI